MFTAIGTSIRQMFLAITVLFQAAEKTAKAVDHLATWGEETAAAFADNARISRAKELVNLNAELKVVEEKASKEAKAALKNAAAAA